MKKKKRGKPVVRITVEWGYESHSLELTKKEWDDIQAGEVVSFSGENYGYEGEDFDCWWCFNSPRKGHLIVEYGDEGGTGWDDAWSGAEIEELN